jgi:Trypsin-like peptidase domain
MLKPVTPAEQLFFVTARLQCQKANNAWSGTGFFVTVPLSDGGNQLLLVTNRHVVSPPEFGDADQLQIITPGTSPNDVSMPEFGSKAVAVAQPPKFFAHQDTAVDVAVMGMSGLQLLGTYQPFIKAIPIDMFANDAVLADMDAIEQVTFIGYPNALHDTANMTPIARRGWTATPISLDYNNQPQFLIDASVFPGSSGSPVFSLSSGTHTNRNGSIMIGGGPRISLLGIVARVHLHTTTGDIIPAIDLPKVAMQQVMNLGVVYKTRTILETIDQFLSINGLSRNIATAPAATAAAPVDPPDITEE